MRARVILAWTHETRYTATVANATHRGVVPPSDWLKLVDVEAIHLHGAGTNRYWSDPTTVPDRWLPREQIRELVPITEE